MLLREELNEKMHFSSHIHSVLNLNFLHFVTLTESSVLCLIFSRFAQRNLLQEELNVTGSRNIMLRNLPFQVKISIRKSRLEK